MRFTATELQAVLRTAYAMAYADDRIDENEVKVMMIELNRFGVPEDMLDSLLEGVQEMDIKVALGIIAGFDIERKNYVASYLGTLLAADGEAADNEVMLWKFVTSICGLPEMTIGEAIQNITRR